MPRVAQDLTGLQFGRLTVLGPAGKTHSGRRLWLCACSCGKTSIVFGDSLKQRHTTSCGCRKHEIEIKTQLRHGDARRGNYAPEYRSWWHMISRCTNPHDQKHYRNYGGRGITVCERWRYSYENFLADMGRKPGPKYSIDRINNDGNYEPGNVRWATRSQQNANQRKRSKVHVQV